MDQPDPTATTTPNPTPDADAALPPGSHPLEVAARSGFGPLSPLEKQVWHGQATPCVSCGQLVRRQDGECSGCGQDLGEDMIGKMRTHAGPWYVLEHVRPFPGVSLERIILQIRRGLITPTSIVRGPATHHQWRFAVETPGLCRYFTVCWHCHETISPADTHCKSCLSSLAFDQPRATAAPAASATPQAPVPAAAPKPSALPIAPASPIAPAPPQPAPVNAAMATELGRLSAAVHDARATTTDDIWDAPPRIGGIRATWVVAVLLALVIVVLLWITGTRS